MTVSVFERGSKICSWFGLAVIATSEFRDALYSTAIGRNGSVVTSP
jgi:hypothetical protein